MAGVGARVRLIVQREWSENTMMLCVLVGLNKSRCMCLSIHAMITLGEDV